VAFLREASWFTNSPSGAWVPISKARAWIAVASALFFGSPLARAKSSRELLDLGRSASRTRTSPAAPRAAELATELLIQRPGDH
jgi:hypothetical protein